MLGAKATLTLKEVVRRSHSIRTDVLGNIVTNKLRDRGLSTRRRQHLGEMALGADCRFSPGKCDFFKVQDNDTTIRLGEKEGQTDVSSALKRFYDHRSPSCKIANLRFCDLALTHSVRKVPESGKGEVKKSKF